MSLNVLASQGFGFIDEEGNNRTFSAYLPEGLQASNEALQTRLLRQVAPVRTFSPAHGEMREIWTAKGGINKDRFIHKDWPFCECILLCIEIAFIT